MNQINRVEEFLNEVAEIARATLPSVANPQSVDDEGMQQMMSGFLFLYDGYPVETPEQEAQLRYTASTCAITYKQLREGANTDALDDEEHGLYVLCTAFLHMYKIHMDEKQEKEAH